MVFKCDDLPASDSICILFSLLVTEHDAPQLPAFKLLSASSRKHTATILNLDFSADGVWLRTSDANGEVM